MICHNKNPTYNHNNTKPIYDATVYDSYKKMYVFESKYWNVEKHEIEENVEQLWSYICGKFSPWIQGNIEGLEDCETKLEDMSILWLVEEFKKQNSGVDTEINKETTLYHKINNQLNMKQGPLGLDTYLNSHFKDAYKDF